MHMPGQLHGLHTEPIPGRHQSQALQIIFGLHVPNPSPITSSYLTAISLSALKMEPTLAP